MGTEPAAPIDGRSLRPLLSSAPGDGSPVEWRDALVIEQWRENPAERWLGLRTQTLKYVRYANGDQELYDLAADPDELENRANNPVYAAERTALAARLRQLIPPATLDQWGITPP
jgi:hypothetical protein